MSPKLKEAKYQGDYRVWLRFAGGVEGVVDLGNELWGEIFQPLKDMKLFAELEMDEELGTIVWPNGADFSPEYLYQQLCPDYVFMATPKSGIAG